MNRTIAPLQRSLKAALAKYKVISERIDASVGISDVDEAQQNVKVAEDAFLGTRKDVQFVKSSLESVRVCLRDVRTKLDRSQREDEKYLLYVTEEHKLVKEERFLKSKLDIEEEKERDTFALFSTAVRMSHEKERARAERTKYWSLIGSAVGTITGFALSSIMTQYRFKKIKELAPSEALIDATFEVKEKLDKHSMILQEYSATVKEEARKTSTSSLDQLERLVGIVKRLETGQEARMKELTDRLSEAVKTSSVKSKIVLAESNDALLTVSDYENWVPDENLRIDAMPLQMYNALLSRISLGLSLFSQGLLLYLAITGR